MQTATLNERGVTLLDRSLVFVPPCVLVCVLDAVARGATPHLSLHVATQTRVGFRFIQCQGEQRQPLVKVSDLLAGYGYGWLCRCNRSYCQCSVPSIRAKALEIEIAHE